MGLHNKTLNLLASKLGIGDEERVLNKAAEFERLLQTKSTAGSNMTDNSKLVICLDLAASTLGVDIDAKTAMKYSGLKSSMYTNCKKIVQNLLGNTEKLNTAMLCLSLQCCEMQEFADRILDEYQRHAKMNLDLSLPQYVCMAMYQACRISKMKVAKSKLVEKSGLKPTQWTKLDADWTNFVNEHFASTKKKRERSVKATVILEHDEQMDMDEHGKLEDKEPQMEPYEDWKRRMLEAAYSKLTAEELARIRGEQQATTPRRSPRKTPQKLSPQKSSNKTKGVRLLFHLA